MLKAGIACLLGVCLLQGFTVLPSAAWGLLLLIVALQCLCFRLTRLIGYCIIAFVATLFNAYDRLQTRLPIAYENIPLVIEGRIVSLPAKTISSQIFYFDVSHFALFKSVDKALSRPPERLRLSWYGEAPLLLAGQRWRLTVKLKQPHGLMNPGGFDYETWLWVQGVDATGYVLKEATLLTDNTSILVGLRNTYYRWLEDRLQTGVLQQGGLLLALAIGYRDRLSDSTQWLFQQTGTAHLLAISGLHIGLAAGFGLLLGNGLWWLWARVLPLHAQRWPRPVFAALMALLLAAFYAALAGFSLPTQRALIMLTVLLGAVILRRPVFSGHGLGIALILILLINPFVVLSAGFWLSFTAVAIITYILAGRMRVWNKALSFLRVQLALTVGLLPLSLFWLGKAAVLGALANIIAIPFVSLLLVPLILGFLLILPLCNVLHWSALPEYLLMLIDILFIGLLEMVSVFTDLPYTDFTLARPPWYLLLLAMLGIFYWLAPKALPLRHLALLLVLPLFWVSALPIAPEQFRLTVLDVGQGLAVLVQTQQHSLLYDTGPAYEGGFSAGRDIISPFLKQQGLRQLNTVLVSHGDNDHRGGLPSLLAEVNITTVLSHVAPAILSTVGDKLVDCVRGQRWQWDGVLFEILHPPDYWFTQDNDASCVLKVSNATTSVLLPGDVEWLGEYELQDQRFVDLQADILIAPHHGSRTSSSASFLQAVQPQHVIFTTGYRNRFAFPHTDVIQRYRQQHSHIWNTAIDGTVQVDSRQTKVSGYRQIASRYWHWQATSGVD